MLQKIIFTDLDGTLLDAKNYSFKDALPALNLIRSEKIPLVFCSSKTRAEIEYWRRQTANEHPFISENGGAIFIPEGYFPNLIRTRPFEGYQVIQMGLSYRHVRDVFSNLRNRHALEVSGFGDISEIEISELTNLPPDLAKLARQRDFDEPFVFKETPDQEFLEDIEKAGLHWTYGRLYHISGRHNKGQSIRILKSLYEQKYDDIFTIGLGDSQNDISIFCNVDYPVLITREKNINENENNPYFPVDHAENLVKSRMAGPAGWSEVLVGLFSSNKTFEAFKASSGIILQKIFQEALLAVDPAMALKKKLKLQGNCLLVNEYSYDLTRYRQIVVVGAGKAAGAMALGVESVLGDKITEGLVVVAENQYMKQHDNLGVIRHVFAGHPLPNEAGVEGTRQILQLLQKCGEDTLVLCLLSGGASALLVNPAAGLTLEDKKKVTSLVMNAGAAIEELNTIRKHLSAVKGGRLLEAAYPADMVTLILSDVIGNEVDVIASGPTAPDNSRFIDALSILKKYNLENKIPEHVLQYLQQGADGQKPETLKINDPRINHCRNIIIGSIIEALIGAAKKSRQLKIPVDIVSAAIRGEARDVARQLAGHAKTVQRSLGKGETRCLLYGGETTVTVNGPGKGGRNQELSLAFALEIEEFPGISLLSAATDGIDGPTDAAGAFVCSTTAKLARESGLEPRLYLANNDSFNFFHKLVQLAQGCAHFVTGPTGTNVMDIQIILIKSNDTLLTENSRLN